MSGLYTVTIQRLHLVSKFDGDGKKISNTTTKVPVTHCDLPYATAMMYMGKVPAGDATMVEQISERAPSRKKYREREVYLDFKKEAMPPKDLGSEDAEEEKSLMEAAMSGDMTAAINAELADA